VGQCAHDFHDEGLDSLKVKKYRSFSPDKQGIFLRRPNRFIVEAEVEGRRVSVHCPNPGRMRELLIPGRKLILEGNSNPRRKTPYTLAAVIYSGLTIPLVSVRANDIAGNLIIPESYPDFTAESEKTLGKSRVDWLLTGESGKKWIEVKACTLVEQSRALFPDAPSIRAVKHLKELLNPGAGNTAGIIFVVMNPLARVFSPNPHTDPDFCIALKEAVEAGTEIKAVSIRTGSDGWSAVENRNLPIDLSAVELAEKDSGLILRVLESGKGTKKYHLNHEYHEGNLRLAEKRKYKEEDRGYRLVHSFTIRGDREIFSSISEELSSMDFQDNPVLNPTFIDWLSDYRHRRVFTDRSSSQ